MIDVAALQADPLGDEAAEEMEAIRGEFRPRLRALWQFVKTWEPGACPEGWPDGD